MNKELKILNRLFHEYGEWITTRELDALLEEEWENEYDAKMHCNSMMRRGLIDYHMDGDWSIDFNENDLQVWNQET